MVDNATKIDDEQEKPSEPRTTDTEDSQTEQEETTDGAQENGSTGEAPQAEAARYRRQLREVEAEIERISAALNEAQRGCHAAAVQNTTLTIETVRAKQDTGRIGAPARQPVKQSFTLKYPDDFTDTLGTTAADYFTESGTLNKDKINADMKRLWEERPNLFEEAKATRFAPTDTTIPINSFQEAGSTLIPGKITMKDVLNKARYR